MKNLQTPTFNDLPEMVGKLLQKVEILESNLSNAKMQHEPDKWLTIEELKDYLPGKPAKQTIYGWVHREEVPFHKPMNKLLFLKSEIDAWLKSSVEFKRGKND